jgi:hypothetical protein
MSKVPYIRDTRRSIGVDDFVMKYEGEAEIGKKYSDSIAVGAYVPDVHSTKNAGCSMPAHVNSKSGSHPAGFYLSLRAHTNKDVENLLVAGKTMAQTFLLNAATRLHPIEFASGTGAGVAAAVMSGKQMTSKALVSSEGDVADIQSRINSTHGTTEWRNVSNAMD